MIRTRQMFLCWCVVLCLAMLGGCTTIRTGLLAVPVAVTPTSKLAFAYVANSLGNPVSMFRISSDGHWIPNSPATIAVGALPQGLAVDREGKSVYVLSSRDGTISMFQVQPDGTLLSISPGVISTGSFPQAIAIDPAGRFVYCTNSLSGTISMFVRDPQTGMLIATNPSAVPAGHIPGVLAIDPSGQFLYTLVNEDSIAMFAMARSSGLLQTLQPPTIHSCLRSTAGGILVAPSRHLVYAAGDGSDEVGIYAIDPNTGTLSPASVPTIATGRYPGLVATDATGSYLCAVNRLANTISQYGIDSVTGVPSPLSPAQVTTERGPWQIVIDPSGELAYVSNEDSDSISIYAIQTDGTLKPYGSAATGSKPSGIGVVARASTGSRNWK